MTPSEMKIIRMTNIKMAINKMTLRTTFSRIMLAEQTTFSRMTLSKPTLCKMKFS